jgi:serpin B
MKNRIPTLRTVIAVLAAFLGPGLLAAQEPAAREAAESTSAFGVDLYRRCDAQRGNIVLSPYSLSEVLALLSEGASGKTQEEMLHVLHWKLAPAAMAEAFAAQGTGLDRSAHGDALLSIANGLWYQQGRPPLGPFENIARSDFRAELRAVDFVGNSAAIGPEINGWVAQRTAGKISDLFPEGSVTRDTRLVLANAVYFKGRWAHKFDAEKTALQTFHTTLFRSVQVPMMPENAKLKAASVNDCDLLELPYAGGDLSMVVFLPKLRDGLAALEQSLSPEAFASWLASLDAARPREVDLRLPRFKIAYAADLVAPLKQLGMPTAFARDGADFSGINAEHDLSLSIVRQKAFIEVNEEGTEAAAATGAGMVAFAVELPQRFIADHPFLFLIRDRLTGSPLFLGRVTDPTKD